MKKRLYAVALIGAVGLWIWLCELYRIMTGDLEFVTIGVEG